MFFVPLVLGIFSAIYIIFVAINQSGKYSSKLCSIHLVIWIELFIGRLTIGFESHKIELTSGFCKEFHFTAQLLGIRERVASYFMGVWINAYNLHRKHSHHLGCFHPDKRMFKTCFSDRTFVGDIEIVRSLESIIEFFIGIWRIGDVASSCSMSGKYRSTTGVVIIAF